MHIVATAQIDWTPHLESVLTARVSVNQVSGLLPRMEQADPLAAPGPARVVGVQLASGHEAVIVFHEVGQILEILAPLEPGIETGLAALLTELRVTPEAITWTHEHLNRVALLAQTETLHSSR